MKKLMKSFEKKNCKSRKEKQWEPENSENSGPCQSFEKKTNKNSGPQKALKNYKCTRKL